jgi:hypothetical protein
VLISGGFTSNKGVVCNHADDIYPSFQLFRAGQGSENGQQIRESAAWSQTSVCDQESKMAFLQPIQLGLKRSELILLLRV